MKTSKNRGLPSSNRYKLAGLKRFTNFMFWGPPLITGSVVFIVWQYQQHPEWLSGTQGEGQTLPQSGQFEEPGIYDDLPTDNPASSTINPENSDNLPFAQPPTQTQPSDNTATIPNPLPQSNNGANSSRQNNPGTKLPDMFPPLLPIKKNQNTSRPPSSYTRSSPIEIDIDSESELQKAIRRRSSQSSPVQNNIPTTGQSAPTQAPPTSTNPTNQNNSITPSTNQNYQNYQPTSPPQPSIPQYTYSPLPSSNYNNQTQSNPYNYNGGQPYTTPSYGNNGGNVGNTNSVPTINGRPAPRFQPSIQPNNRGYDQ